MRRALPLLLVACSGAPGWGPPLPPVIPPPSAPLFARLGGKELLDALAADLLANVATDERLAPRLAGGEPDQRRLRLASRLCTDTGGSCAARPEPASTAAPLTEAEQHAIEEAVTSCLERFRVGGREQVELAPRAIAALSAVLGS